MPEYSVAYTVCASCMEASEAACLEYNRFRPEDRRWYNSNILAWIQHVHYVAYSTGSGHGPQLLPTHKCNDELICACKWRGGHAEELPHTGAKNEANGSTGFLYVFHQDSGLRQHEEVLLELKREYLELARAINIFEAVCIDERLVKGGTE